MLPAIALYQSNVFGAPGTARQVKRIFHEHYHDRDGCSVCHTAALLSGRVVPFSIACNVAIVLPNFPVPQRVGPRRYQRQQLLA